MDRELFDCTSIRRISQGRESVAQSDSGVPNLGLPSLCITDRPPIGLARL
jgi:hypothetical protein